MIKEYVPIITFFLGFFLNNLYDYYKKKKENTISGIEFEIELEGYKTSLKEQITITENYCNSFRNTDNLNSPDLGFYKPLEKNPFDRFQKHEIANYLKRVKKFDNKKAINIIYRLSIYSSTIEDSLTISKKTFDNYIEFMLTNYPLWYDCIKNIIDTYEGFIRKTENFASDELLIEIDKLLKETNCFDTFNGEVSLVHSNFCKPLNEILSNLKYRKDERVITLKKINLQAMDIAYSMYFEKEILLSKLQRLNESIRNISLSMESIVI